MVKIQVKNTDGFDALLEKKALRIDTVKGGSAIADLKPHQIPSAIALSITPLTGILNPLHHSIQVAQHERKTQPLRFHPTASIQLFYPHGSPEKLSNSESTIAERTRLDWHGDRGLSFLQLGLRELARLCYERLPLPILQVLPKCNPPPACASQRKRDTLDFRIEFSKVVSFSF